ncbi:MAG: hypothetical protein J7K40_07015 [candidate division Zixibacteria bacterium]|nr:hypothetical protein [candidate division Zixibacteria bacterium]
MHKSIFILAVIVLVVSFITVGAIADWEPGDNYEMHFPQLPDEDGWGVNASWPMTLADDWLCTESGWIQDIHYWGSWKHDYAGEIEYFILSIHDDIPDSLNPSGYSMPENPPLWTLDVPYNDVIVVPFTPDTLEGWFDPNSGEILDNDHLQYFQYNIFLDEDNWFWQEEGTVYWLNISAVLAGAQPDTIEWGWNSSENHWNDKTVWCLNPDFYWIDIYEPAIPISNTFTSYLNESGDSAWGWGSDAYGEGWYYYPESNSWNIWFYDHPMDTTRKKIIRIEFDIVKYTHSWPSMAVVSLCWSNQLWVDTTSPPVESLEEEFIDSEIILAAENYEGLWTYVLDIEDFNPAWVSVKIQGNNFSLMNGVIDHACYGSLDMAFVISGESGRPAPQTGDPDYNDAPYMPIACHQDQTYERLGQLSDNEPAPIYDDDTQGITNDDDGLIGAVLANGYLTLRFVVSSSYSANPGSFLSCSEDCVDAWVDWNGNDRFEHASEYIGSWTGNPITGWNGPFGRDAVIGTITGFVGIREPGYYPIRLRLNWEQYTGIHTPSPGSGIIGTCDDWGEVEDEVFYITPGGGNWDYKMHFPQLPDETGWDANATWPMILADDWMCSETGWVKDIHFWGSWRQGLTGNIDSFLVRIHYDVPANQSPTGYSMPGLLVWENTIGRSMFEEFPLAADSFEGWFTPAEIVTEVNPMDNWEYWRYDILLPDSLWFEQENGVIYWLSISAFIEDMLPDTIVWGWKSSSDHWNDNSVWVQFPDNFRRELYEPTFPYTPFDINDDGYAATVADLILLINYLNGVSLPPYEVDGFYPAADCDGNCVIDINDYYNLAGHIIDPYSITLSYCTYYPPDDIIQSLDLSFVITGDTLESAPDNNDCENASAINDGDTPFSTLGSTTDNNGNCSLALQKDIWFRYTAACTGTLTVDLCYSNFDTYVGIFDNCNDMNCIATNNDGCGILNGPSYVQFVVSAGIDYLICVGGNGGATGSGIITITCAPTVNCFNYLTGDVNMHIGLWPPVVIGSDVTYLINYFRGIIASQPCFMNNPASDVPYFWASADVNGDCIVMGSDATKLVTYFRGTGSIDYCISYTPCWPPLPPDPPSGWPNCQIPPVLKGSTIIPSQSGK